MKHLILLVALGACTDTLPPIKGTTSIAVTLVSPADPGSVTNRLPDTARTVMVSLQAKDADNLDDPTYSQPVQVYVHFLGTLSPYLDGMPLQTITMTGGKATNVTIMLPPVFGPTTIWFDDGKNPGATYATGISPTLWYRDPYVADIQTPTSETALDAFSNSPLVTKNIAVDQSRHGPNGLLVVTSVFAQGYTVADVMCAGPKTPPCTAQDYDYVEVFSFSAPADQQLRFIAEGQLIDGFAGGISEFDGLTEIGFPQTFSYADMPTVNTALEPPPVVLDPVTWFSTNKIEFERNEAGAIEIDNGKVCPLDDDYTTFKQWKIDPAGVADTAACKGKSLINVITTGVVPIDPATLVGKTVPRVVGILRPINIGSFNVWIIYPRSMADLTIN
jgi:hypothetical protein